MNSYYASNRGTSKHVQTCWIRRTFYSIMCIQLFWNKSTRSLNSLFPLAYKSMILNLWHEKCIWLKHSPSSTRPWGEHKANLVTFNLKSSIIYVSNDYRSKLLNSVFLSLMCTTFFDSISKWRISERANLLNIKVCLLLYTWINVRLIWNIELLKWL